MTAKTVGELIAICDERELASEMLRLIAPRMSEHTHHPADIVLQATQLARLMTEAKLK